MVLKHQAPMLSAPFDFIIKITSWYKNNRKELFNKVTERNFQFFIKKFKIDKIRKKDNFTIGKASKDVF